MGEVTYIIISEEVFDDQGNRVIVKPYSTLFLPALPNNFSFTISFGIIDLKYNTEYEVNVKILDPKNKLLLDQTIVHNLNNPEKSPETIVTSDLTMYCKNFLFEETGHYLITISLDGDGKSLIFPVYKSNRYKQ